MSMLAAVGSGVLSFLKARYLTPGGLCGPEIRRIQGPLSQHCAHLEQKLRWCSIHEGPAKVHHCRMPCPDFQFPRLPLPSLWLFSSDWPPPGPPPTDVPSPGSTTSGDSVSWATSVGLVCWLSPDDGASPGPLPEPDGGNRTVCTGPGMRTVSTGPGVVIVITGVGVPTGEGRLDSWVTGDGDVTSAGKGS